MPVTAQSTANRKQIIAALLAGEKPMSVSKRFPMPTVYRIYNKILSGEIDANSNETTLDVDESTNDKENTVSNIDVVSYSNDDGKDFKSELDIDGSPSNEIINQVRGVMGIVSRPKVLTIPMPELLYTAMVISIQKWGWTPMRPDDFIDTVLDKYLRLTGIEVPAYIDTIELSKVVAFAKEHGYTGGNGHNGNGHNGNGHDADKVSSVPPKTTAPVDNSNVVTSEDIQSLKDMANELELKQRQVAKLEHVVNQQTVDTNQAAERINMEQTKLSEQADSLVNEDKTAVPTAPTTETPFVIKTDEEKPVTVTPAEATTENKQLTVGDLLKNLKLED